MKKTGFIALIGAFVLLASFTAHKFYVAIYQVNYASDKKMLQITSRIFVDDMNTALWRKYNIKTNLDDKTETAADNELMRKYLLENFSLKVNGQPKTINYLSKEFENNVLICYFNVKEVTKVKTLEVRSSVLFDAFPEQQNIIQANISGQKQNALLNGDTVSALLKFD